MKCRNSSGAFARTLLLSMAVAACASAVAPSARADLVEEVEDLDRQPRADQQPTPSSSDTPSAAPLRSERGPVTPAPKPQVKNKADEKTEDKAEDRTDDKAGGKVRGEKRHKPVKRTPIQFESKSLQAVKDQSRVVLQEDVLITQGDFRLQADEATIYFDKKTREAMKVIASGRVKAFKSDVELKQRVKAECNEAVFYNQERKMVLRGNAKLWRGEDLVRGKQITYELDTGWIKADRVEGVVQPGGKK